MQSDDFNPPFIGEEKYKEIQKNKDKFPKWLVGYVGFNLSFAAKFFGGYRRDKAGVRDYENEAQQNLKAQQNNIKGIKFVNCSYDDLIIPNNSIIYCDPPYQNTTKYKNQIDYSHFWQWVRTKSKEGHKVYVSEYNAPSDFECLWEKKVNNTLTKDTGSKQGVEKLFRLKTPTRKIVL